MVQSFFDIPLVVAGPVIVLSPSLFALGGLLLVRRRVMPLLKTGPQDAEFSSAMLQAIMVFYGLTLALIAVNVWQTYDDVSAVNSREATAYAALFRDVSVYPEPARSHLRAEIRSYIDDLIHVAWPLQRRGRVPTAGVQFMNRFQALLASFEPATEGQKVLHAETWRAYNHAIEARRLRLDAVTRGLPAIMWGVVVIGAVLSLVSGFFFQIPDARLHGLLVVMLAAFIGLVIFVIFALDRPFRGDLGLSPAPYQLIFDQLMKPHS